MNISFTHKLNSNHQTLTAGEICKGHPVTVSSESGNYSKVRFNGSDVFIPTKLLIPITSVVA